MLAAIQKHREGLTLPLVKRWSSLGSSLLSTLLSSDRLEKVAPVAEHGEAPVCKAGSSGFESPRVLQMSRGHAGSYSPTGDSPTVCN